MRKVVVLVAPHSPDEPALNLGAAKKIELVASLLSQLGFDVHYVDSAHPPGRFRPALMGQRATLGKTAVTLWRPFCVPSRKLGKMLNIFTSQGLFRALARLKPQLVWVYNPYAFEARLGLFLQRAAGSKLVMELEDLPTARGRGFNPKPLLDQHYFKPLLARSNMVTFVNAVLLRRFTGVVQRALLFPSILQNALVAMPQHTRFAGTQRRLGYFGGLETDKGVGILLNLPPMLPPDWKLVVTGVGSLTPELQAAQARYPDQLEFHGAVSHDSVLAFMQGCDAIVNPHAPITHMDDGVFPFKVCEAIASGALLISTALPSIDIDLSRSVLYFDGSAQGLADAVRDAAAHYAQRHDEINQVRQQVCAQYGEQTVLTQFRQAVDGLLGAH